MIASVALRYLRATFSVAASGAHFHLWPDCCDRTNNFSALVHRDAVSASQGRVRTQHAQDSFNALKTVRRVLQQSCGRSNQTPMQIREPIAAHDEFAHGTAFLYVSRDVGEVAFITVELVREATL